MRRPCPRDPYENAGRGGGYGELPSLEQMNEAANQQWKNNLAKCQFCGRGFLPEKLIIHNRSCTASNPARSVGFASSSKPASGYEESDYSDYNNTRSMKNGGGNGYNNTANGYGNGNMNTGSTKGGYSSGAGGYSNEPSMPASSNRSGKLSNNGYGSNGYNDGYGNTMMNGSGAAGAGGGSKFGEYRETPEYGHLIKCNECGRNFNEESYAKHAKICRKVFKNKRKVFDSSKARAKGTELASYLERKRRSGSTGPTQRTSNNGSTMSSTTGPSSAGRSLVNGKRAGGGGGAELPKWKAESLQFREAMKQARMVSMAEKKAKETGVPLHTLLPPIQSSEGGYGSSYGGGGSQQRRRGSGSAGRGSGGGDDYDSYGGGGGFGNTAPINPGYIQCPHCGRSYNQKAGERHIPQCQSIVNKPSRLSGHSGAPSYSTLSPPPAVVTRGTGFGASTRQSALNNTAVRSRTLDPYIGSGGDSGGSSKAHGMSDAVKLNRNSDWGGGGGGGGSGGGGMSYSRKR